MKKEFVQRAYELAKEQYATLGVDTDAAIAKMKDVKISLHCWQTDDVGGFEKPDSTLGGGGIQVTGNYPGKARSVAEMKMDLEKAMSLLPGKQRLNLHAIYGDFAGQFVDRDQIEVKHFQGWIDWAKEQGIGLDFNATCFSHPKADMMRFYHLFVPSDGNDRYRDTTIYCFSLHIPCRTHAIQLPLPQIPIQKACIQWHLLNILLDK